MSADKRQLEQYYAFLAGHIDEVRRMTSCTICG